MTSKQKIGLAFIVALLIIGFAYAAHGDLIYGVINGN